MTRLLGTMVVILAIIAAIGVYRGWFVTETTNSPDQSTVNVTVDKNAIRQDASQAQDQVQDAGQAIKDKLSPSTAPSPNP